MPAGGGYATNIKAHAALADSVQVHDSVRIQPELAMPAYCSGATYLVFLKTLQALQENGTISLSHETWAALVPRLRPDGKDTLPDGESVWGRWNANGPGTARLFHQLGLGRSFTEFSAARSGDFMKVFWTDAVGKKKADTPLSSSDLRTSMASKLSAFGRAIVREVSGRVPSHDRKSRGLFFPVSSTPEESPIGRSSR